MISFVTRRGLDGAKFAARLRGLPLPYHLHEILAQACHKPPRCIEVKISLVIPAHNEQKLLGGCLDAAFNASRGRLSEIIVVDNASDDRTAEIATARRGVRLISEHQKGLVLARERGRLAATGDLIAYIDADSRISTQWIDFVVSFFAQNPDVVSLSGPPTYYDANQWQRLVLKLCWTLFAPPAYHLVGYMLFGAGFVVRKGALNDIGGFNRGIQFYGEDTDLARRLSAVGKVVFRMNFRISTSARRFSVEGTLRTNLRYAINFVWPILFHRPYSISYRDIR
jgi:glycosyltransferase involved in cell wall biosynthesis